MYCVSFPPPEKYINSVDIYIFLFKDENLRMEHEEDIYRKVCDSNWIGSISEDIRSSVFNVLYDLFPKDNIDSKHYRTFKSQIQFELQIVIINQITD